MATIEQILANNLKHLMAASPDVSTQPKLEERSGVAQTTIGRILRAETQAKIGTVKDLAKVFKLNPGDLLDSSLIAHLNGGKSGTSAAPDANGLIPLFSWVTAGTLCEAAAPLPAADAEDWLESPFPRSDKAFCLKVRGQSMWPDYKDGEIIQVDPEAAAQHNDDVILITADRKATFKRLQESEDGRFLLTLNPDYPDRIIRLPEGALISGVCIGSWMDRRRQ